MAKRKKRTQEKEPVPPLSVKERIADLFEIPEELIADTPKFTLSSNRRMLIQNYTGLLEYDEEVVRVNTKIGVVKIEGKKLAIENMTAEEVQICGFFTQIQFTV